MIDEEQVIALTKNNNRKTAKNQIIQIFTKLYSAYQNTKKER